MNKLYLSEYLINRYVNIKNIYFIIKVIDPSKIILSSQNCASTENGAYTGEISAKMLSESGVKIVILGHSERRNYFKEDSDILFQK